MLLNSQFPEEIFNRENLLLCSAIYLYSDFRDHAQEVGLEVELPLRHADYK